MRGAARNIDATGSEMDEEQHVDGVEPGSLNGKEIAGEDLLLVMFQQFAPATTVRPLWSWQHAVTTKDCTDGGCSNAKTKLEQFALNAVDAPAAILLRETQDKGFEFRRSGGRPRLRAA